MNECHNIFQGRFAAARVPAWHKLGLVFEEPVGAVEAFRRVGPYDVALEPLQTAEGVPAYAMGIVRGLTNGAGTKAVLGVVKGRYRLLTPEQFLATWDEVVQRPIETLGCLGKGETIFVTTALPSFEVKGDEVKNYLMAVSRMTGQDSIVAMLTPTRVVCQNTLRVAMKGSEASFRVTHFGNVLERFGAFLGKTWDSVTAKTDAVREACEILASCQVGSKLEEAFTVEVYPMPSEPESAHRETVEAWERAVERVNLTRETLRGLFETPDSPATRGTAWGLYNSVVELEDFLRRGGDSRIALRATFGSGAQTKERAFRAAMALATGQ